VIQETVTTSRSHSRNSSPSISRLRSSSASSQRDHSPLLMTSAKCVPSFVPPSSSAGSRRVEDHSQAVSSLHHRSQTQDSERKSRESTRNHDNSSSADTNVPDSASSSVKSLAQSKPKENRSTQQLGTDATVKENSSKEMESQSSDKSYSRLPKAEAVAVQTEFELREQAFSVGGKVKKPSDLEVMEYKVFESGDSPIQEATIETISPTTGVYTAPSHSKKQQRNSRKPVSKSSQKTGQSSWAESTPPPQGQVLPPSKRDHIVRKESESSLKSADSESTASSSDKSEDKELADISSSQVSSMAEKEFSGKSDSCADLDNLESPLETKGHVLIQLGKEPNTGQTMHPSDDVEVILTEDLMKKDKGKTKRKQRQLKKEEKAARKKEKDKVAAVSKTKERQQTASSEEVSRSGSTPEAMTPSDKPSAVKRLVTAKSDPLIQSKVTKSKSSSYESNDVDAPKKAKEGADVTLLTKSKQPSPPPHPPPSVPSTAIKSLRGGPTKLKDIMMDPFSRNPDRSTYASKKTSSKKLPSSEKNGGKLFGETSKEEGGVVISEEPKLNTAIDENLAEEESEETSIDREVSDKNVTTGGPDGSTSSLSGKDHQQQNFQTPHDLASGLLSKIHMKIKKVQSSPSKSTGSVDCEDEEEGELVTASGTSVGQLEEDSPRESRTSTISPNKDSSLSSPSPPLSSGQIKPSTLSLDAQPFYPAGFKPSKKHAKAAQRAKAKARLAEGKTPEQDLLENRYKKPALPLFSGRRFARDNSPHMGSPVDPASLEQQQPEFYQQHRRQSDRQSPPSPTYGIMYGPDPRRYRGPPPEAFYDSSEMMPPPSAFRRVPDQDLRAYGSGGMDEPSFPHPHMERVPQDMDPYLSKGNPQVGGPPHSSKLTPANLYQLHQKAAQQPRLPGYFPPPPPGYEGPPPPPVHSHVTTPEEEYKRQQIMLRKRQYLLDLYRQERAALAAAYAREQARKSAEALSSLHRPPPVPSYSHDPAKHPGMSGNIWEDYHDYEQEPSMRPPPPPPPPLSYGIPPDDLESSPIMPPRSRTLSGGSDIGGEILTGYSLEGQTSRTVGPPGYKRAPGAEYNTRLEHNRAGLEEDREMFARQEEQNDSAAMDWSPEVSTTGV